MSAHHLLAAAYTSIQPVDAYALSAGRFWALVAALLGLVGAVVAGVALVRTARGAAAPGRRTSVTTIVLGATGIVIGALVVTTADGGLNTGNGLGGGIVAMVVGLIAIALGGLALSRSRSTV